MAQLLLTFSLTNALAFQPRPASMPTWLQHAAVAAAAAAAGAGGQAALVDTDIVDDSAALALFRANAARSTALVVVLDAVAGLAAARLWAETNDARWLAGAGVLVAAILLHAATRSSFLKTATKGSSQTYLLLRRESRFGGVRAVLAAGAAAVFCVAASG